MVLAAIKTRSNYRSAKSQVEAAPELTIPADADTVEQPSQLLMRARQALLSSGFQAVTGIQCTEKDGAIILSGKLPSFYLKQVAQQCILSLEKGVQVINDTTVVCEQDSESRRLEC